MSSDDSTSYSRSDDDDEELSREDDDEDTDDSDEGPVRHHVRQRHRHHSQQQPRASDNRYSTGSSDFESITGFGSRVMPSMLRGTPRVMSDANAAVEDRGDENDEDEEPLKELFTNTFVENGPAGLGTLDALQIAVVFEEMSDQLDIIGTSIDAPDIDLRSKASVEYDLDTNRPVVTIPATYDPNSNSLFKEKYILRQQYHTVAAKRIEQMCSRNPGATKKKRLSMALRDFGMHKFTEKGKVQMERTQMSIILENVAAELIKDLTFESLLVAIEQEREKYEGMKLKVQKSIKDKNYITESKDTIRKLRIAKKKAKKEMQDQMWQFEANRQELLKRKELEFLYVNHSAKMTKERMKKMCAKSEKIMMDKLDDMNLKKSNFEYAHILMLDVIYKKYKEAQRRLEHWVEKYEVEKEALQTQLDQMKANRARDLKRIAWLKAMIKDYEQIVKDDRRVKGIEQGRLDLEKLKNKKAVKIQAWWRGEMYRKSLGPYNPKKKEKAKGKGKK